MRVALLSTVLSAILVVPAWAGQWVLQLDQQTHGNASVNGTPEGAYSGAALNWDTGNSTYASLSSATSNASVEALGGGAHWRKKWTWQGMDQSGWWHIHGNAYRQGSLSASLQNPNQGAQVTVALNWMAYPVSRTANYANPTVLYTNTGELLKRNEQFQNATEIDRTYSVGCGSSVTRSYCQAPCVGEGASGDATLVKMEMTQGYNLHQGQVDPNE